MARLSALLGCLLWIGCVASPVAALDGATADAQAASLLLTFDGPAPGTAVNRASQAAFTISGRCSASGHLVTASGDATASARCTGERFELVLDLSAAPDGIVTLTLGHEDGAGDRAAPVTRAFAKDTVAPSVVFLAPAHDAWVNAAGQATLTLSGSCTENGRPVVLGGAVSASAGCAEGAFSATIDVSGLSDGALGFVAAQTDLAGNTSPASSLVLRKDTTPPQVAFAQPAAGAVIGACRRAAFPVSGSCSEGVVVLSGATLGSAPCTAGAWSLPLDFSALGAAGSVTVAATVTDPAGNQASAARAFDRAVTFAVVGDFGLSSLNELAVANLIHGWDPELILTTGDNNYPTGGADTIDLNIGQYYHAEMLHYPGGYGVGSPVQRFFPSLGNHDWGNVVPGTAKPYLDYFELPGNERYYELAWGPARFYALDSDPNEPDGITSGSVQGAWLKGALAASTSPFNIVYFHHPPYSSGPHQGTPAMRWPFKAWGAQVVLSGHDHTYERIVKGAATPGDPSDDLTYFVNGTGGAELTGPGATRAQDSQVFFTGEYGAQRVVVSTKDLSFQHLTAGGDLIDAYTLGPDGAALPEVSTRIGADWKYLDNGSDQGLGFAAVGFDDTGWAHGPGELGYGDGGEGRPEPTLVGYGEDPNAKHITTYFRHAFQVSDPGRYGCLTFRLLRDDGAVVYLNGTEVFRSNLPAGPIGAGTLALTNVSGADEARYVPFAVDPALLRPGKNVVAVEVHQFAPTSTDLSFALQVIAE